MKYSRVAWNTSIGIKSLNYGSTSYPKQVIQPRQADFNLELIVLASEDISED